MATDTAILVTDIIINENKKFEQIPFIDDPEMINKDDESNSVSLEGFRYVSNNYNLKTGEIL